MPKLSAIVAIFLSVVLLLSLSACGNSDAGASQQSDDPASSSENGDPAAKYGELLELNDNREASGVVVVKVKISASTTNDLTIAQNYHNAVDFIQSQGFDDCELQYWAVAEMSDGTENKVISFTVPQDVVGQVAAGDVAATQLPDLVTDLWILPSLQG